MTKNFISAMNLSTEVNVTRAQLIDGLIAALSGAGYSARKNMFDGILVDSNYGRAYNVKISERTGRGKRVAGKSRDVWVVELNQRAKEVPHWADAATVQRSVEKAVKALLLNLKNTEASRKRLNDEANENAARIAPIYKVVVEQFGSDHVSSDDFVDWQRVRVNLEGPYSIDDVVRPQRNYLRVDREVDNTFKTTIQVSGLTVEQTNKLVKLLANFKAEL